MVLQGEATDPYRGPDRRGRNDGALMPVVTSRVVMVVVLVAVGAGTPALFLIPRHPTSAAVGAYGVIVAGLLFMVTGGLQLVSWKVTGRAGFGWLGSASTVFGVMLLVSDGLSSFQVGALPGVRPADQLIGTAIAGWLAWRGFTDEEVNAGLSPLVVLCWCTAAGLFLMGALNAAQVNGVAPVWLTEPGPGTALAFAAASIWAAVGLLGARLALRGRNDLSPWGVGTLGLLALGCAIRALPAVHWASTVGSAGCFFAAASLAVGTCISRIELILRSRDRSQRSLQLALTQTIRQAATDRQDLEELLHDVRNAVAGLQAADAVLRGGFDGGVAQQPELADAVTAELARLHALVDPARQLDLVDLSLAEAIQPVLAAERAVGAEVRVRLDVTWVRADRGALGRVLQNVLTNARLYAPGTPVALTAVPRGDRVEIAVHDGGPGVPLEEQATVFDRGWRGASSSGVAGNGLGLYVARTLMAAMGGHMRLEARVPRGCCVVLSVPAALSRAPQGHRVPATWAHARANLPAAV